ncbi:MAG TPA: FtsX-like permease family protein [Dehalococcoidia bacterium]|nr:FtsX-like permease family protein [Dehalococcoidia bacterium]
MRGFAGIGPLVWERLVANWRMLAVLAFGMVTAAALLAVSPIYTRVMNDLGLDFALKEHLRSSSRNSLVSFGTPLGSEESAERARQALKLLADRAGWFTGSEVRYAALPDLPLAREGEPVPTGQFRTLLTLQTSSGLDDHVSFTAGRAPRGVGEEGRIEVALPSEAAAFLGVGPGDTLVAAHSFDDCNRPPPTDDPEELRERARFRCIPQVFVTLQARLLVTGVFDPRDANDPYWAAGRLVFSRPAATETQGAIVPVVLGEEGFFKELPKVFPGIRHEFRVTSFADIESLNSSNLDRARTELSALKEEATGKGLIADLAMLSALEGFNRRASFNQVSLLLLLLQVVGIALYYVVLVASLLVERRSEEIAMLRSRGASVWQIMATSAIEAGVLATAAALAAPFLAAGAVSLLGKTATFKAVSGGDYLDFVLVPEAFLLAAGGAVMAVVAVLLPTFAATRRSMLDYLRGAARPQKPFVQRYYLDFLAAGLAAFALWELNQRGSVYDPRSVGGWSADPLLLASPVLLILAIGALMFRLLPLALGLAGRFIALTSGPGVTLGLWQVTRSPSRYSQLALLVVMAAAVGTFAATYGETTDRSQIDRALYEAGVDARTGSLGRLNGSSPNEIEAALSQVPGVEQPATAFRSSLGGGALGSAVPVLALDTQAAPELLYFREDFAAEGIRDLLLHIQGSTTGGMGLALPNDPVAVSLWANPTLERPTTTLWLRTLDSAGTFRLHEFGVLDFTGYRKLTAQIVTSLERPQYPVSIAGLVMTQPSGVTDAGRGNLLIDDLTVIDATGQESILDDFEGALRWDALRVQGRNRDALAQVSQGARRGSGALQYSFRTGTSIPFRAIYPGDPNIPLPAIASPGFLRRSGARVGSEFEIGVGSLIMPVRITGTTDLFPTMYDSADGYLLLNQDHLYYFNGLANLTSGRAPNEVWFRLPSDPEARAQAKAELERRHNILAGQILDVQEVLGRVRSDPVVRAGGTGILLLAVIAAFGILALGFGLTLYTGGQARTVEVAVMRAMGFSTRQIFSMVSLEYLVVAVVGLVVGTVAGLRISATMLSFLNVTADGARVVPPFDLATRWDTVGVSFAVIALAFSAGILALVYYFLRLPMTRFLRLTR